MMVDRVCDLLGRDENELWVRDAVEKVEESKMTVMLEEALRSTVDQIKPFGVFATPVVAGLDKHKIPRYDPTTDRGYLTRGEV